MARPGTVYLVGAGPGDPGLITVRGRALLDSCDAIVYDALVPGELLVGTAELHFVGKRGGDERSARQDDINATLIRLARAGKSVVRLKGGDPFVFGRGGEEAQALAAANVPFEVVPGVTAGIAGAAYAGIPVTHRGISTAVTFVTGSEDPAKLVSPIDWAALARAGGTIVLYMGVQRLPEIAASLVRAGLSPETPAAAIQWATTAEQRTIEATVATIAGRAHEAGLEPPVLTVIGPVVALRATVRWFDRPEMRPLLGRRILVTRPADQASALSEPLRMLGAVVSEIPSVRIEMLDIGPLAAAFERIADYRHMVFTSPNAVRISWDALRSGGRDARALASVTVSAVGPATAAALMACGIAADVTPARFVADALRDALQQRGDLAGCRVLYPSALDARDVLARGLREGGASVDVVPIYRTVVDRAGADQIRATIEADALDLVTLTSASAARAYADAVGPGLVARVRAASIGPITSEAARASGIPVAIEAREATIPGLVAAVVDAAGVERRKEKAERRQAHDGSDLAPPSAHDDSGVAIDRQPEIGGP